MQKPITLFLYFFCCLNSYSQLDFREGFIVTSEGERINGFLNYKEGYQKFSSCEFKDSEKSNTVIYFPNQLQSYGYNDDAYFITKEIETPNLENLNKVFLEVLVKGKATLYKHRGSFYIEKADTIFHELENKIKTVEKYGQEYVKKSKRYVGVLNYMLSDCPTINKRIKGILLKEKSLTQLVEAYNSCSNESSITYKSNKKWIDIAPGVTFGLNSSTIELLSGIPEIKNNLAGTYNSEVNIMPGLFFDFTFQKINERFSLHTGAFILKSTYETLIIYETGPNSYRNDITLELKQIKIPVGIRYNFPDRNITPFINAGLSTTIPVETNSLWIQEREGDGTIETTESIAFKINEPRIGYWAGLGIKKKLLKNLTGFSEIRYEFTEGPAFSNEGISFRYRIPNFQFLIGFNF